VASTVAAVATPEGPRVDQLSGQFGNTKKRGRSSRHRTPWYREWPSFRRVGRCHHRSGGPGLSTPNGRDIGRT